MHLDEMDEIQQAEEALFVQVLSQAGWNVKGFSDLLHSGVSIHPEGNAELDLGNGRLLVLEYHAEERFLILVIARRGESFIRFKFIYTDHLKKVLELIVNCQSDLDFATFPDLLKKIIPLCEQALLVTEDGEELPLELEE